MVTHSSKLLQVFAKYVPINGTGLEIAPYFDPILKKADHSIEYTDYVDMEEMRRKAALNPGCEIDKIVEIDFVWKPDRPLKACVAPGKMYDYAIASHVMEHVPNPVGWINDIFSVMRPGGRLALFLPDRRHSFDYFRRSTKFEDLVSLFIEQPHIPTSLKLLDFMVNSFADGPHIIRGEDNSPLNHVRAYSDQEALDMTTFAHREKLYLDAHCTVWEAESFASVMEKIFDCGLLNGRMVAVESEGPEFLAIIEKLGDVRSRRLRPKT